MINVYCKCGICGTFFDVTKKKKSKFCSPKCRQKNYRNEKDNRNNVTLNLA
jgi:hypothetical protein